MCAILCYSVLLFGCIAYNALRFVCNRLAEAGKPLYRATFPVAIAVAPLFLSNRFSKLITHNHYSLLDESGGQWKNCESALQSKDVGNSFSSRCFALLLDPDDSVMLRQHIWPTPVRLTVYT